MDICNCCGKLRSKFLNFDQFELCIPCHKELSQLKNDNILAPAVIAPFIYKGLIRTLTIRAKVQGNLWAAGFLTQQFVQQVTAVHQSEEITAIIAVASSLWSRLYGRTDMAAMFSSTFANVRSVPMFQAPPSHGWHLRKRSFQLRRFSDLFTPQKPKYFGRLDRPWERELLAAQNANPTILIVDDVHTTGYSLNHLQRAVTNILPQATVMKAVLATARAPKIWR